MRPSSLHSKGAPKSPTAPTRRSTAHWPCPLSGQGSPAQPLLEPTRIRLKEEKHTCVKPCAYHVFGMCILAMCCGAIIYNTFITLPYRRTKVCCHLQKRLGCEKQSRIERMNVWIPCELQWRSYRWCGIHCKNAGGEVTPPGRELECCVKMRWRSYHPVLNIEYIYAVYGEHNIFSTGGHRQSEEKDTCRSLGGQGGGCFVTEIIHPSTRGRMLCDRNHKHVHTTHLIHYNNFSPHGVLNIWILRLLEFSKSLLLQISELLHSWTYSNSLIVDFFKYLFS